METTELLEIAARGEDSKHQFKVEATNASALAQEIVAFANSGGGQIFIGIDDNGLAIGLSAAQVGVVNQLIGNAATTCVRPSINVTSENVTVQSGVVVVVTVPDGLGKPYQDNAGSFWVKNGSDKRKVTAREEIQRMFQSALLVHGDAVIVPGTSIADVDLDVFREFFKRRFDIDLEQQTNSLGQVLTNMRLLSSESLTVAGLLLFGKTPSPFLPVFHVKAVRYPGKDIHATNYIDSADLLGRIQQQFEDVLGFLLRNIHWEQGEQNVTSVGTPEIPRIVFEELIANALIHRDYFVSAPIRIFMFDDRIEIISPGHLPNNLTVANIRSGNSNARNPILASFATKLLPYRGLGNGILRALKEYPDIDFFDDRDGNLFKVIVKRRMSQQAAFFASEGAD